MAAAVVTPVRPDARTRIRSIAIPRTARGVGTAAATLAVALLLLVPVGAGVQIAMASQIDDHTTTQAIVVMQPSRIWGDADPVLQARLAHAAELFRAGVAPVVLLPGQIGAQGRLALTAAGVPAADIVAFRSAPDTISSLEVVAGAMQEFGWHAATVVTDPVQAARTGATAEVLGIDAHISPTHAGPGSTLTTEYVGRETMALLRHYALMQWSIPRIVH